MVVPMMPSRRAARTPRAKRASVMIRPMTNVRIGPVLSGDNVTTVPVPRVTKPAFTRPIKRMNRPMPTPIACFRGIGIAFRIASRKPVRTSAVMTIPSMRMMPMAACHGSGGVPSTSWYATTALSPRPAAIANGLFA